MANSLFEGVSGLQVHQQMLDVVGNNLANLNTTGFKAQAIQFSDLLYQTLSPATASTSTGSGTDPIQVGFGVKVATINTAQEQGTLTSTGGQFDLALEGSGFFVARAGSQDLYTRAGSFSLDQNGFLVDPATGYRVQRFGTVGEGTATDPAFQTPGSSDIKVPLGIGIPGAATANVTLQGNLTAAATGPAAQVLTSSAPFLTGGVAAVGTTLLNNLDDNTTDYGAGDSLRLQGVTAGGAAVNVTVPVDGTTTLNDLVNDINANFPGSTASLSGGNLVVTSNTTGQSDLTLAISDVSGNTGATAWGNHSLQTTTTGKDGDTVTSAIQIFDVQGRTHNLSLTFQKQADGTWSMTGSIPATDGTVLNGTVTGITFNDNGSFRQVSSSAQMSFQFAGLTAPQAVSFSFGSPGGFNGLTQFGGATSASATNQDGFAAGFLTSLSIAKDGTMNGVFTNGRTLAVAQLAVATFANPGGLTREGNNYFSLSAFSGEPQLAGGGAGGRGSVQQGALESSNVDVAQEFTRLIIAQRGFEVNTRTITVSDQVLQDLSNIIH